MKLVTYLPPGESGKPRPGAELDGFVIDLQDAASWVSKNYHLIEQPVPDSILGLIQAGKETSAYINQVLLEISHSGILSLPLHTQGQDFAFPGSDVRLLPPIQPVSLRDAYAFEQHVRKASENKGRPVPTKWYEYPAFYYTNAHTVIGHDSALSIPSYSQSLDFELEIAAVIGHPGIDLSPDEAEKHIFGFTIFNDWSARDVQLDEMKVGLGPAKGKDFSSSLGPCILTVDELSDRATGRPGVFDLQMTARINGQEISRANFKDIYWSFGQIIARVTAETPILPGEVIGSGTVGTGCLLELTRGEGPWLQPGDLIELEIERIGVLRNTIWAGRKPA